MNQKEVEILELIRRNPYLSQQEMAERLNMSRPSLANFISNLMRQGKILGRAYVLPEEKTIICIGGANVDRKFLIDQPAQMGTSNPSSVTGSVGGVARNVAENLGRLGHSVKLLSIVGNDPEWNVIESASSLFMSTELTKAIDGLSTGTYTAILEPDGEMLLAMADMKIYDFLTPELISKNDSTLLSAAFLVIDLNCPLETVEYVRQLAFTNKIPLAVIPVSAPKMDRLSNDLTGISWLILNRDEASKYLQMPIDSKDDWHLAVQQLLDMGAAAVVVTGGKDGAIAGNSIGIRHYHSMQVHQVADVTGAGDAFSSAIIHSVMNDQGFETVIHTGMVNAAKTLESKATVRHELTSVQLQKELEELQ
ncbi:putative carbohydrate kinase [Planococcus antarcticus DSM 14505]|uniref:Carbohydrate kinase n=1 Tax=Planococcus antarcticus DSM 14505 TaxID=1185653 RepID=A0A1C7DJF8_9BACL|nr:carbohydrate kinase [Planococcus antarcticus]ANU11710.1 carbohydrate kinase [Planococcus antarcticus DSM 14505]EIM06473.1 putative carbohydrate kinase [Planococcus antarcticus DSM 14505]